MDPRGHIYEAPEDEIPEADTARLDGYLRGRAEADAKALAEEKQAEVERLLREREESDG